MGAQDELDLTMDPIFTSDEVSSLSKPIESLIASLRKKPKPMVKNEMKNGENTVNDTNPIDIDINYGNSTSGVEDSNNVDNSTIYNKIIADEKEKSDEL